MQSAPVLAGRYDTNQLTDLIYGVGEVTMHADVANTLRIELEPEFADRLPNGVPYTTAARWTGHRLIGWGGPPQPQSSSARSRSRFTAMASA